MIVISVCHNIVQGAITEDPIDIVCSVFNTFSLFFLSFLFLISRMATAPPVPPNKISMTTTINLPVELVVVVAAIA